MTTTLPDLIIALRNAQSYTAKTLVLILLSQICLFLVALLLIAYSYNAGEFALFFGATMLAAGLIPLALTFHTFRKMMRSDLVLPEHQDPKL